MRTMLALSGRLSTSPRWWTDLNATAALPPPFNSDPAARNKLGMAMIDGLAALAKVDPIVIGLENFGKLEGFLTRQVPRWASQLESYNRFTEWPGPSSLGQVEEVGEWLNTHMPSSMLPGLMHGDYHLGKRLVSSSGWRARGHSRLGAFHAGETHWLDLGRLLAAWPEPDGTGPLSLKVKPWSGFPDRGELIQRYAEATGRSLSDLLWFEVLACYKLGIIIEGSFARASAGLTDAETGMRLHRSAQALFARASNWIQSRA